METNNTTRLPLDWFRTPASTLPVSVLRVDANDASRAVTQRIDFVLADEIALWTVAS